jgi:hypothetical protein
MSGDVIGHIITGSRSMEYRLHVEIDGHGLRTVTSRTVKRFRSTQTFSSVQDLLSELQSLDGQNWSCAVDGLSMLIEGVTSGKRFAFDVSNAFLCNDKRSALALRASDAAGPWR